MLPEEQNVQKEKYEQLCAQSKKMKKRIVIIFICIAAGLLLLLGIVKLAELLGKEDMGVPDGTYEFYPVYDGDIMDNKEYLGLNRQVSYCADPSGYGITESITEENRLDFDVNVIFLYEYLQTIIAGNADSYNTFFNEAYFKNREMQGDFAQQMLYNMKITYYSTEEGENNSKLVTYRLEYMIHRNNGTFRRDMGSDAIRPQYVTLRVTDDSVAIEKLVTQYTK